MAYKIYTKGNYVFIDDTTTGIRHEAPKNKVVVQKELITSTKYWIKGFDTLPNPLKINSTSIQKESGDAYTDGEWVTFYTENTANFSQGGGATLTDSQIKTAYENNANTNAFTDAAESKLSNISVTAPINLDDISTRVANLDAAVVLKGSWDASGGVFPNGGTAQAGFSYIVSVAGTVDGVGFVLGDRVIAIADNASTTNYAANWFKADYTDQVLSVNGSTGAVTITDANLLTTDVVTNNASITKHGFLKKLSNTATEFMNGVGDWVAAVTATSVGAINAAAGSKTTPVNTDNLPIVDSEDSSSIKRVTFANLKAFLKTYFDTIYSTSGATIITAESSGITGAKSGVTNYTETFTLTGAVVGDHVSVGFNDAFYDDIKASAQNAVIHGKVVSANNVEITYRIVSFLAENTNRKVWAQIVK